MKTRIFTAFALLALLLSAAAAANDKWIHIKVDGGNDEQVTVNRPLSLLSAASAMIPDTVQAEIDRETRAYTDFRAWCKEVVWWGNKKGAYLYTNNTREQQLAGHY